MNDDDWGVVARRLGEMWPTQLTDADRATYRDTLGDLDAAEVLVALSEARNGNGTPPAPDALRERALALAAAPPATPPAAYPPPMAAASTPARNAGPSVPGGIAIRKSRFVYAAGIAAAVVFISCFMPWVSSPFVDVAGSSTDDGKVVLLLAALGVGVVLLSTARVVFAISSAVLGVVCAIVMIVDLGDIQSSLADDDGFVSAGAGLYLGLVAAVIWVVAAVFSGLEQRTEQRTQTPS